MVSIQIEHHVMQTEQIPARQKQPHRQTTLVHRRRQIRIAIAAITVIALRHHRQQPHRQATVGQQPIAVRPARQQIQQQTHRPVMVHLRRTQQQHKKNLIQIPRKNLLIF